jgi:putative transposase
MTAPDHHRRSIRLKGVDYTQPGAYFVTLVTSQRQELFGQIINGQLQLNPSGKIVRDEWLKTAQIRPQVQLYEDEFIIMPNHLHGIISIVETLRVGATPGKERQDYRRRVAPAHPVDSTTSETHTLISNSIDAIMGQFKSVTAKRVNALRNTPGVALWQRNYYEHIVRNENELKNFRDTIETNPLRWEEDQLHPSASPNPFNQDTP